MHHTLFSGDSEKHLIRIDYHLCGFNACAVRHWVVGSEEWRAAIALQPGNDRYIHFYILCAKQWYIKASRGHLYSSYSRYHRCYVCHEGHIWWVRLLDESTNIVIIKCVKCCFVLYCWIRTTRFLKHSLGHRTY